MSGHEVTITLGRSGQVVIKRDKRSRGDGSNAGSSYSKRHRKDSVKWSSVVNGHNGSRIAKNDLRLKLMRKRLSRRRNNVVEARGKVEPRKTQVKTNQPLISSGGSYMLPPHEVEANRRNVSRVILQKEIADDSWQMSSENFHSYQTLEASRSRSPDRIQKSYVRILPPRSLGQIQHLMPMRAADISRGGRILTNDVVDASRLRGSSNVIAKATSQPGSLVTQVAPTRGIMQPIPHVVDEPQTVASFLLSLGLGKYAVNFQHEEVDMSVLKQMGEKDLKEMGIPMGPRKKIIIALMARLKRQAAQMQMQR